VQARGHFQMKPDYLQDFISELERDSIVVKTGKLERDSKGELQPTYAFAPKYAEDNQALADVLFERYGLRH
jgi:hypothetical protein